MECYRRAMIGEQTFEGRRDNLSQANKLSRTYALLLDVLNRHRGKGQQKVTVEHVHVHSGGQAVVGVVETPGGGDRPKSEDQPHAKQLAHAPEPAMWSTDKERETVPIAAMPNGRCRMHGGLSTGAPRGNQNALKHGFLFGGGHFASEINGDPDPLCTEAVLVGLEHLLQRRLRLPFIPGSQSGE